MNLPKNYIVVCDTKEETNIVMKSVEQYKDRSLDYWNYWKYCTFSDEYCNIFSNLTDVSEWFKRMCNVLYYKTFTFKEWKKRMLDFPENWKIKITDENIKILKEWRTTPFPYDKLGWMNSEKTWSLEQFNGFYREITTEQFKEHIFKIKPFKHYSDVIYEMIITHPYFKDLSIEELTSIIGKMNINGYDKLEGDWAEDKATLLFNKFNNKTMQKLTITGVELLEIHKIACKNWKSEIADYLNKIDENQNVTFTQKEIDEMFNAATKDQKLVLERIFGKQNSIEWNRIKTGSKVMLKNSGEIIGGINSTDYNEPFDVVFWKTPYSIDCANEFKIKGRYNSYATFHQNSKYIRFDAGVKTDYITSVIEY